MSDGMFRMTRQSISLLVVLLAAFLQPDPAAASQRPEAPPSGIGAVPVATGLDFPGSFTLAPDGRIFYGTTSSGQIHIYDPSSGSDTVFFTFAGGTGIFGVALAPDYPAQPYAYAYTTTMAAPLVSRIVRIRDVGGVGTRPRIIYQADAGPEHEGGRLLFGTDGMLWVVTGDTGDPANSQDLTNTLGKMLRMTPTGDPAPGNPFGDLVWAYGLRNSFGWDFDGQTGFLWEEDNGPECNDEINLLIKGRNYGWGPNETCSTPPPPPKNTNQDGPRPVLPAKWISTPTAPTGVAFCEGCGLTGAEGTMFYGNYNTSDVHQIVLTPDRRRVASDTQVYVHTGFVLSIESGPDGTLYFSDASAIYRLVQA